MISTLYTDATWDQTRRRGGWAIWCRSDSGRIVKYGPVPSYVEDNNVAEFSAIFAGIHIIRTEWSQTTMIVLKTDSQAALNVINGDNEPWSTGARRLQQKVKTALGNTKLRASWVKGHQRGSSVPAWLNNKVDQLAKRGVRRA